MAKVSRILGEQLFPERRLLLQSPRGVRHVVLPGWLQAMLLATSFATIGVVAYLCVGSVHLRGTLDRRAADATPTLARTQPPSLAVPPAGATRASDPSPAPSTDTAAFDDMRSELATLRQQNSTLSENYAQANANYQQATDKLAVLTQQNSQLQSQLADANARSKTIQVAHDEAERRAKTSEQALNSKNNNSELLAKISTPCGMSCSNPSPGARRCKIGCSRCRSICKQRRRAAIRRTHAIRRSHPIPYPHRRPRRCRPRRSRSHRMWRRPSASLHRAASRVRRTAAVVVRARAATRVDRARYRSSAARAR